MQRGATKHSTTQQQSCCHCQPAAHRDLPPSVLYVCECACVSLRCCSDLSFPLPLSSSFPSHTLLLLLSSRTHPTVCLHPSPALPIFALPTPSCSIPLAPCPSAVALPLPPCLSAHSRSSWPNPPDPSSGAGSSHTPSPQEKPAQPEHIKKRYVRSLVCR